MALAISACSEVGYAQTDITKMIQERAAEKVVQMCDYNESIANPQNSLEVRRKYKDRALRLFVANCGPYEEEGINREGVIMEVTSKFRKKPTHPLMKDYFERLMLLRYDKVVMKSSDIHDVQVSELRPIDNHTYVCTAAFVQVFVGYRDGRPIYSDRTKKSVKCYITIDETIDGNEYIVELGDTKALQTSK